jgi:hypothetical protein
MPAPAACSPGPARAGAVTLALRPATPDDRPRIRRWLVLAEAKAWLGDAPGAEARISLAMASTGALCRMVEEDGAPIGYCHAVEAALWAEAPHKPVPAGTWELELFIAPRLKETRAVTADAQRAGTGRGATGGDRLPGNGRTGESATAPATAAESGTGEGERSGVPRPRDGRAAEALSLLAEEVFATTLALACYGLVPVTNEAAARAYEGARFRWRQIWSDPVLGPSWVMLRERPL